MPIEFIALTVFVAVILLTVGIVSFLEDRRNATSRRLMAVTGGTAAVAFDGDQEREDGTLRFAASLVEKVGFWSAAKFATDKKEEKTDDLMILSYAGYRTPRARAFFTGIRLVAALVMVGIVLVAAQFIESEKFNPISALIFAGLFGYYGPKFYVNLKVGRRQLTIVKSLPDVLDMLIICVEAGLGLNAALDRVARERTNIGSDVMGDELRYMTYELQAGIPREQAFHNLGTRNGVDDLKALAAFMVQSEKLGGSLTEALKIYASELRERRRQRAQEQANKAAIKLLFPLVFFIFPCMFIVILAPAIMQLSSSMKGLY
jgi:tight adherence protein C